MKYKVEDKELWVLVEVYISFSEFVAHWYNSTLGHIYQDLSKH